MTPANRRNCGLGETLANLLLIGCAVVVVAVVAGVLPAVVILLLSQNVTNFNYFATF